MMFSGIVGQVGEIIQVQDRQGIRQLTIDVVHDTAIILGESIAINGVCLTIADFSNQKISCEIVQETLERSNLGRLNVGDKVNVERALRSQARNSGHFVQGHIDCQASIHDIKKQSEKDWLVTFSMPESHAQLVVPKGFIGIDGMSITVVDVDSQQFSVSFVPYTIQHSIVQHYQVGQAVNIEIDVFTKTLQQLLRSDTHALPR